MPSSKKSDFVDNYIKFLNNNHTDMKDIHSIIIKNININEYEKSEKHKNNFFEKNPPQKKWKREKHINDNISSFFDKKKERNKKVKNNKLNDNTNKIIYNNSSRSIKYKNN
tara:strand:- start:4218 stop:4550 length:333 start_codon:yes stop_codon:yes gene_type:complete